MQHLKRYLLACLYVVHINCGSTDIDKETMVGSKDATPKHLGKQNDSTSNQIILVHTKSNHSFEGILYGLEFVENDWLLKFDTVPCSIGKNGFAELSRKKEGDGKTPSGAYIIGAAFGDRNDLACDMDFIELSSYHYWVTDTSSNMYNTLVEHYPGKLQAERMKRKDHLYKYGIIIEYNTSDITKGAGSAIFIHVQRSKISPTAGCIAVSEDAIKKLIQWIKPSKRPIIIMGSADEVDTIKQKYIHLE